MKWPLRNQILLPLATTLVVAVGLIAGASAYWATLRAEQQTAARLEQVVDTLGGARIPYTPRILEQMQGLSGADFIVFRTTGEVVASTITLEAGAGQELLRAAKPISENRRLQNLSEYPAIEVGANRYFAAALRPAGADQTTTLIVLYPESSWRSARWQAAFPPLALGAATILAMLVVAAGLAHRISLGIRRVQQQVSRIAEGHFEPLEVGRRDDELRELALSINHMCGELQSMHGKIRQAERSGLLSQLAGGLAHQLRNAVTGARMAIQIHQKRCAADGQDESLAVALRQLSLTEEHVKGLLSLQRKEPSEPTPGLLREIAHEVVDLTSPACTHGRVALTLQDDLPRRVWVADAEPVRSALLNLLLNAIEAAGPGGEVSIGLKADGATIAIDVRDNGPGPPENLKQTLFEPFVTTKPEGVGLGLALAHRTARDQGGELTWRRENDQTVFCLSLSAASGYDQQNRVGATDRGEQA